MAFQADAFQNNAFQILTEDDSFFPSNVRGARQVQITGEKTVISHTRTPVNLVVIKNKQEPAVAQPVVIKETSHTSSMKTVVVVSSVFSSVADVVVKTEKIKKTTTELETLSEEQGDLLTMTQIEELTG